MQVRTTYTMVDAFYVFIGTNGWGGELSMEADE
jgi:hypothetical protein